MSDDKDMMNEKIFMINDSNIMKYDKNIIQDNKIEEIIDEDVLNYCKTHTPRNMGDENLEMIQTRKYAQNVLKLIFKHLKKDKNGTYRLTNEKILDIIKRDALGRIHRNKKYPENKNIFLVRGKIYIYENNKWSIVSNIKFAKILSMTFSRIVEVVKHETKLQEMNNELVYSPEDLKYMEIDINEILAKGE